MKRPWLVHVIVAVQAATILGVGVALFVTFRNATQPFDAGTHLNFISGRDLPWAIFFKALPKSLLICAGGAAVFWWLSQQKK